MDNVPDMTTGPGQPAPTEQQLRDAMVEGLIELGAARDPRVIAAFRTVPRHLATPEVDMAKTYGVESATITKTDEHGVDVSSVSAPRIQAMQIEQADIAPGMRVLEIGSGGPNAANLAEMVGDGRRRRARRNGRRRQIRTSSAEAVLLTLTFNLDGTQRLTLQPEQLQEVGRHDPVGVPEA